MLSELTTSFWKFAALRITTGDPAEYRELYAASKENKRIIIFIFLCKSFLIIFYILKLIHKI